MLSIAVRSRKTSSDNIRLRMQFMISRIKAATISSFSRRSSYNLFFLEINFNALLYNTYYIIKSYHDERIKITHHSKSACTSSLETSRRNFVRETRRSVTCSDYRTLVTRDIKGSIARRSGTVVRAAADV